MSEFLLMAAPLQGYTDSPFRHFHSEIYGTESCRPTYFSPFIRLEKGTVRPRDIREITSELNENHRLIPQVICRDADEFRQLVGVISETGHRAIDINMGCPFVPQVRKGRGAGLLAYPERVKEIKDVINSMPQIAFSVKMRLGISSADEWRNVLSEINDMNLTHVTIHPRTASQQYSGELHFGEFEKFAAELRHLVVFNGDITSPDMIDTLRSKYPHVSGVMVGRGLLSRPSIFAEWAENREWDREERIGKLLRLHEAVYNRYCDTLSGETQILSKIKPLWEYFGAEFDRKAVKAIMKATKLAKYDIAVQNL